VQILHRCCFIFLEAEGADADNAAALKWALCCIKTYSPNGLSLNEQGLFTIQVIILVGRVGNCIWVVRQCYLDSGVSR
jgi:hypothetical protein